MTPPLFPCATKLDHDLSSAATAVISPEVCTQRSITTLSSRLYVMSKRHDQTCRKKLKKHGPHYAINACCPDAIQYPLSIISGSALSVGKGTWRPEHANEYAVSQGWCVATTTITLRPSRYWLDSGYCLTVTNRVPTEVRMDTKSSRPPGAADGMSDRLIARNTTIDQQQLPRQQSMRAAVRPTLIDVDDRLADHLHNRPLPPIRPEPILANPPFDSRFLSLGVS